MLLKDTSGCSLLSYPGPLPDVKLVNFSAFNDPDIACDNLVCTFQNLVDKHVPLKAKVLRQKNALFMTHEVRKTIPEPG